MTSTAHIPLVVVADDDPADISRVEGALTATGLRHKVVALPSGESAMNYLQRWLAAAPGDAWVESTLLLLAERGAPNDDLAALRWVRAQPRLQNLPVIVLGEGLDPEAMLRAHAAGANAFVGKTLPDVELTEIFGVALLTSHEALPKAR